MLGQHSCQDKYRGKGNAESQAIGCRFSTSAKFEGHEYTEGGCQDEAQGHDDDKNPKWSAAQLTAVFPSGLGVDAGEFVQELRVNAEGLPDPGDREEQEQRGEDAAEV